MTKLVSPDFQAHLVRKCRVQVAPVLCSSLFIFVYFYIKLVPHIIISGQEATLRRAQQK